MSKLEQLDSGSAGAAPDEVVEPRIARAVEQASAPSARDEALEAHEVPLTDPPVRASATSPQEPPAGERVGQRRRRRLRMLLSIGGVLVVAAAAGVIWLRGGRFVSTGDAYIQAARLMVSTDVSGIVSSVDVHENQLVKAGDVLFRIDPRQFQIAVDNAKANLAQTALTIESMKQDYKRMLSDVAAQRSQVELDQANYDRYATLVRSDVVSKANYDQARFTLAADTNKLESLRQQAAVQLARLAGNADIPDTQHPQYIQAKAQVDEAQRQLDHAVVRAPASIIAYIDDFKFMLLICLPAAALLLLMRRPPTLASAADHPVIH